MRALVMAAGLGTRLRPLTDTLPKPLVPVRGRPMVEYVLEELARAGVAEAVLNVHYLPGKMREFVQAWNVRGGIPRLREQDEVREILGSGGAVALAAPWLFERDTSAIVCNSDVIASPDYQAFLRAHRRLRDAHGVECTLAVVRNPDVGVKYTGLRREADLITAFEKNGADPTLWHFPGFYVIEKSATARLPKTGASFGIVDELWRALAREGKLGAWEYGGPYFDLGSVEDLRAAEAAMA